MARAAEWSERVEEWRASGQPAEQFCRGRGYSARTLQWWSWQLKRKPAAVVQPRSQVLMARVVRTVGPVSSRSSPVVVELCGGRVHVEADAKPETLRAVFLALREGGQT